MVVTNDQNWVSPEIRELAFRAAQLRRTDLNRSQKSKPMKDYFARALKTAGLEVTRERLQAMGKILGSFGGKKTAALRRAGSIFPRSPTPPAPFCEFLFPKWKL